MRRLSAASRLSSTMRIRRWVLTNAGLMSGVDAGCLGSNLPKPIRKADFSVFPTRSAQKHLPCQVQKNTTGAASLRDGRSVVTRLCDEGPKVGPLAKAE